ncbi:3-keto-5-aminohexanoate cleavage enzyme [Roseovarius sp. A-2]|uniref:3-keto-5-aminohexanoate cleavage protein n=1 Tax=Roseovarius sp. A-2 TaxID=1570360 RepID=UPI0009C6FA97|nr:3-keto-5-aminohexanoate cleavage protein [Roseovarius sp. A-2]GAW35342.1 3-keto-5-aminohexanoate cleavage enzyme [Roseovarius sp. A-2]
MALPEIVQTARDCAAAGADGLHLHLRDDEGRHVLDAGLYREALAELHVTVPQMALQITTEAAGPYAAPHQRAVALEPGAGLVSVALREMVQDTEDAVARAFYMECHSRDIFVQHILYGAAEIDLLARLLPDELLCDPGLQLIFVLGRYSKDQDSAPDDLTPFLARK